MRFIFNRDLKGEVGAQDSDRKFDLVTQSYLHLLQGVSEASAAKNGFYSPVRSKV